MIRDHIPNHTTLCKFSNEIVVKNEYEHLLKKINKELEKRQDIVKTRVIVDASITVRSLLPTAFLPT
ncbi:MAG: hypothetical protein ACMUEL_07470 [Flavobacteriales bacterium Tduv]